MVTIIVLFNNYHIIKLSNLYRILISLKLDYNLKVIIMEIMRVIFKMVRKMALEYLDKIMEISM